jgi:predicted nucleic acid-binding protein
MQAYWDASAALALIFDEVHSPAARKAQTEFAVMTAWSWTRVEIEAGAARRDRSGSRRAAIAAMLSRITWLDLNEYDYSAVITLNLSHRLRASDAGHLFCLRRIQQLDPAIALVCFDTELCAAARAAKLRVWSPR